jgi:hypothetical protein
MPHVVTQGCETNTLGSGEFQPVTDQPSHVAGAHAVLESRVSGAWVDQVGQGELLDPSQPLKRRRIDDLPFTVRQRDQPVDRVTNLSTRHAAPLDAFPTVGTVLPAEGHGAGSRIVTQPGRARDGATPSR